MHLNLNNSIVRKKIMQKNFCNRFLFSKKRNQPELICNIHVNSKSFKENVSNSLDSASEINDSKSSDL